DPPSLPDALPISDRRAPVPAAGLVARGAELCHGPPCLQPGGGDSATGGPACADELPAAYALRLRLPLACHPHDPAERRPPSGGGYPPLLSGDDRTRELWTGRDRRRRRLPAPSAAAPAPHPDCTSERAGELDRRSGTGPRRPDTPYDHALCQRPGHGGGGDSCGSALGVRGPRCPRGDLGGR